MTEDAFLKMVTDLNGKSMLLSSFQNKSLAIKIDFASGRLFQRFSNIRRDATIDSESFKRLVESFEISDIFAAGRMFERYSKSNPKLGLFSVEFQTLCRESPFGSYFQAHLNKASPPPPVSNPPEKPHHQEIEPQLVGGLEELSMLRRKQVKDLDIEISALENELNAELLLGKDLPEAFCKEKESMLRQYLAGLVLKREQLVSAAAIVQRELISDKTIHLPGNYSQHYPLAIANYELYYR